MFVYVCMRVHYTELRDTSCLVFHVLDVSFRSTSAKE